MRKSLIAALALALAGVVYSAADPEPACAACSPAPCSVSSQCASSGCTCLKTGQDAFGVCVSFD